MFSYDAEKPSRPLISRAQLTATAELVSATAVFAMFASWVSPSPAAWLVTGTLLATATFITSALRDRTTFWKNVKAAYKSSLYQGVRGDDERVQLIRSLLDEAQIPTTTIVIRPGSGSSSIRAYGESVISIGDDLWQSAQDSPQMLRVLYGSVAHSVAHLKRFDSQVTQYKTRAMFNTAAAGFAALVSSVAGVGFLEAVWPSELTTGALIVLGWVMTRPARSRHLTPFYRMVKTTNEYRVDDVVVDLVGPHVALATMNFEYEFGEAQLRSTREPLLLAERIRRIHLKAPAA